MTYPAGDQAEDSCSSPEVFHVSSSFLLVSIPEWRENILQSSYVSFIKLIWMSAFYSTQRYWKKCLSSLNNSPWYSSISCISKLVDYLNVYYNRTFNIRFLDGLWVVDESSDLYVVVQSLSRFQLFVTPWTEACQALLSCSISWSLLKLMSIESVMPPNDLVLCRPLLLLTSIFPSIRVFYNELALRIRWPKDWGFSFSIWSFQWIFRVDFL